MNMKRGRESEKKLRMIARITEPFRTKTISDLHTNNVVNYKKPHIIGTLVKFAGPVSAFHGLN